MNKQNYIKNVLNLMSTTSNAKNIENQHWWQKRAIYQIYPKSFFDTTGKGTGDLRGIISKLDYIKSLGICAIWLTPIYPSPMVDNGYDISDYTAIDPRFGTMADFEDLIEEAKTRDIKIVMDLVFNHSSDQHPWFLESKSSCTNSKADWYIWQDGSPDNPPTNWRGIFGDSAWQWCEERRQFYLHTFAAAQPDLNWENPDVRRALYDVANFWIDKGVGGFRIDAIVYIKKPNVFVDGTPDADGKCNIHKMIANTPGILDFLREFKENVFEGRDIFTVAEAGSVKPEDLSKWVGERGVFDMLFEFSHVKSREIPNLSEFKAALTSSQKATRASWYPIYFENHDRPRSVNNFFPDDSNKILAAKAMAIILFTLRGTPFIYQGEELGFENVAFTSINDYDDISSRGHYDLARAKGLSDKEALRLVQRFSRDNARTPMQWNSEKNSGFTSGQPWLPVHENFKTCNAAVEEHDVDSVLNFYRQLSAFRNSSDVLIHGEYRELLPENEKLYIFTRTLNDKKILTVVNFTTYDVELPAHILDGARKIFGNYPDEKNFLRPTEAIICEL